MEQIKLLEVDFNKEEKLTIFSLAVKYSIKMTFDAGRSFGEARSAQAQQQILSYPQMANVVLVGLGELMLTDESRLSVDFAAQVYFWIDAELQQIDDMKPTLAKQGQFEMLERIQEGAAAMLVLKGKLGTEEILALVEAMKKQMEPKEESRIILA